MEANIFQTLEQETNVSIWFKAPNSKFWIKEVVLTLGMAATFYKLSNFDDSHFLHGRIYQMFPEKYDPNTINYNSNTMDNKKIEIKKPEYFDFWDKNGTTITIITYTKEEALIKLKQIVINPDKFELL